jgi:hypothetical protein
MTGSTRAVPSDATEATSAWVGRAFGLNVTADLPILGLDRGEPSEGDPPHAWLRRTSPETIDADWVWTGAEQLITRYHPDGTLAMTVHAHTEAGYRIDAPGYGRFRITPDGALVQCAPAPGPAWRWHRPFVAQALPLAATLNGMELLHASAAVVDGKAIAFTGHSGAGKTSLGIHLVDQGASLLADDVVALSADGEQLRAHPGVRFANVDQEQIDALEPDRRGRLGRVVGSSDKVHILVDSMADAAAPLAALYFLHRRPTVSRLEFELVWPPEPPLLLAATFMPHITASARLTAQLRVCSLIADRVPTFKLHVPPFVGAAELAATVAAHARQLPANQPAETS